MCGPHPQYSRDLEKLLHDQQGTCVSANLHPFLTKYSYGRTLCKYGVYYVRAEPPY